MRVVKNDPSSAITLTTQPNVIPALHWGFAYEQLKNQRDGTKLRYYQKADLIPYSTGLGYDITLSYPVRFHRGKFFLKKNGVYTSDNPPLSYTLLPKAERELIQNQLKNAKKDFHLPTHTKTQITHYYDSSGNNILLNFPFIILNNTIFAMSGYGHVLEMGTYGKIKLLMAENNKEKFVLKIFLVKPSSHLPILKNVGHLIACAQKNINQKTMQLFPYLGVDLFKFFTQLPKPVPINMVITVLDIIFKTILAVEDLHKKNIAHLDLKLENIVWDEHQKKIHLIDFDFAEEFTINEKNERVVLIGGMRGTLTYLPPEILKILPTSSQYLKDDRITEAICLQNGKLCYQFSQKTEIYALGKTIKRALRHVDCQETQFYFDEMRYLSILMSHILAENRPDFDFMKMISIYCLLYVEAKANQHGDDIFKTQVENQLKIHQCGITQFEFVKLIVQNSLMNTEYPATLYHFVKNPYLFEMFRQHGTLSMCQYIITREKSIEDVKSPAWLRFVEYHKNFYTKLRFNYNDQRFFCQNECQTQQEICNEIDALFQRQLSCDDPLDERNLIPINNEITTLMQSLQTLEAQSKQAVTDPKIVT